MIWIVILLSAVLIIIGISSGMQSYASAQQAQAQIEMARAMQISAGGNLVTILGGLLIVLIVLILIVVLAWFSWRRFLNRLQADERPQTGPAAARGGLTISDLVQLEMIRTLREMRGPQDLALPAPHEEPAQTDDPLHWLKN